jgi:hypothetical protein
LIHGLAVLKRAADMSIALDHHLFDTLYHAVRWRGRDRS